MTPLQETMLQVSFSAVLGIEMALILILAVGVIAMIVDLIKWVVKRRRKKRAQRDVTLPRRDDAYGHPWHEKED